MPNRGPGPRPTPKAPAREPNPHAVEFPSPKKLGSCPTEGPGRGPPQKRQPESRTRTLWSFPHPKSSAHAQPRARAAAQPKSATPRAEPARCGVSLTQKARLMPNRGPGPSPKGPPREPNPHAVEFPSPKKLGSCPTEG